MTVRVGNLPLVGRGTAPPRRTIPRGLWREAHHRCGQDAPPGYCGSRRCNGHPVSLSHHHASILTSRPMLQKLKSARWPIALGMLIGAGAYLLFIYSDGEINNNQYWRWYFPGFVSRPAPAETYPDQADHWLWGCHGLIPGYQVSYSPPPSRVS